jgi:hypothetical protein
MRDMKPDAERDRIAAGDSPDKLDMLMIRLFAVAAVVIAGIGAWALFFRA